VSRREDNLKPRTTKKSASQANRFEDDLSVPVWVDPHLTQAFYKRLAAIAERCRTPRYKVIQNGIELFLQQYEEERGLISKVAKSKTSAKQVRQLLGKISKTYWETLSEEEKRERGKKAAAARWGKKEPDSGI
jgi:hypothetical protein